jgi:hypothetical protein
LIDCFYTNSIFTLIHFRSKRSVQWRGASLDVSSSNWN